MKLEKCSEDQVWNLGPDLWGRHRHDRRLCVGWLQYLQDEPNEDPERGGGESGGDLRRPIHEGTKP